MAYQLAAGAAIGLLAGLAGALVSRRAALPLGSVPDRDPGFIVASYGAASLARASGFLAVYLSALVLGMPGCRTARPSAVSPRRRLLAQIGLFVMLGLLASLFGCPGRSAGAGGGVGARAAGPADRGGRRDAAAAGAGRQQAFLSWAGSRGAVRSCWPRSR